MISIRDFHYCDNGPHAGKWYVTLAGYVTEEELESLKHGLRSEAEKRLKEKQ
jgi:hypothetical protein